MSNRQSCADDMRDRVFGVYSDLKAFIYIRHNNLQHQDGDNIGGGNTVAALSLFSAMNFMAKCYYCTIKPEKFADNGHVNETDSFTAFVKFLMKNDIDLNLPTNGEVIASVWNGFRNCLAHRLIVESGNSMLNFVFNEPHEGTITQILERASAHAVFELREDNIHWIVNCDALLSKLMLIADATRDYILGLESMDDDLLVKVVDV